MKKLWMLALCLISFTILASAATQRSLTLKAFLQPINEVPPNATNANGTFMATQNDDGTFNFTLTFSGLAANAVVAHIHFGPTKVAGGVMIFLCGGGGQPACPDATSGTVTGTFGPANVVGPTAQGVAPGDLPNALRQIVNRAGYVNVHNATFPAGEIRGQVTTRGDTK
jgi:CHRD domain